MKECPLVVKNENIAPSPSCEFPLEYFTKVEVYYLKKEEDDGRKDNRIR